MPKCKHPTSAVSFMCSLAAVVVNFVFFPHSSRHIATSCYSGEVKLWSSDGWQCEDVTQAPMAQQHHVSITLQSSHSSCMWFAMSTCNVFNIPLALTSA